MSDNGVSRARELLAQAVQFLGGSTPQLSDSGPPGTSQTPLSTSVSNRSSSVPYISASASVSRSRVSTALAERSCLFNFGKRGQKSGESKAARSATKRRGALWSHEFVCLSDTDQDKTPSSYERGRLLSAGMYHHENYICQ